MSESINNDKPSAPSAPNESNKKFKLATTKLLKASQKYSAYGILAFAGLHLTSTVILPPISFNVANKAFMVGRSVYQSELGEFFLVYLSFGIHILSGFLLRMFRLYWSYKDSNKLKFPKVSTVSKSGFVLTFLTSMHFLATRVSPTKALGDSSLISLEYMAYCLNVDRIPTSIALVLLTTVFATHAMYGATYYFKIPKPKQYLTIVAAGLATLAASALAKHEPATGWLAEQFELAHSWLPKTLSGSA